MTPLISPAVQPRPMAPAHHNDVTRTPDREPDPSRPVDVPAPLEDLSGFDLTRSDHWGQPPSVVIQRLASHLLEKGGASVQAAHQAAYRLLINSAPEYLVKDIPASVTCASVLWAQLAMAVGRIEAHAPGRTLGMGYAEILLNAESLTLDAVTRQRIDGQALTEWGVANGVLTRTDEMPSASAMERLRAAYNEQLSALKSTSALLQTPIPSRRAMALALLERAFPDVDPSLFEVRHFQKARLTKGRPGIHPGSRSMLDIVMHGGPLATDEHWVSNNKRLPIDRFCSLYQQGKLEVASAFTKAYDQAISAHQTGQQSRVRQMIATLPLEDRNNLEFGKLEFFHTNQYTIAKDLFTPPALHVRGHTLEVKATRNGEVNLYTLDTRNGTVEKENFLLRRRTPPYTAANMESREANILSRTVQFESDSDFPAQPQGTQASDSLNSRRSHAIADVFVKSLDLNNEDLMNEARGLTSFDRDSARNEAIGEFFLNLIPLRSAIVNFQNGNIGQGVFDLGLDAVGLVTLGAGKAVQAGKVLGGALTTARQAAKAVRFVGATAVEAFNPLSGVGDLLVSGGRWVTRGSASAGELSNRLFRHYRAPESSLTGLSRNNQGVYVAADGHRSYVRHLDASGQAGVYEVRQVSRGADGSVQARVYHNNRQTPLLLERVQDDQWRRLGARGGQPVAVKADLGPEIGRGGEGVVYTSLDGKSVYKDLGPTRLTSVEGYVDMEVVNLNKYYGEGFAEVLIEDGRKYIKMGKVDGVDLAHVEKGSLPAEARSLLDDAIAQMEARDIFHNDPQLSNFMYSKTDNKLYPIDMNGMPAEFMVPAVKNVYDRQITQLRSAFSELIAQ